jgi:hypothetical protein
MILTKLLALLKSDVRLHQYARRAAVYRVFVCMLKLVSTVQLENLETCNAADPRLGTRIGLA